MRMKQVLWIGASLLAGAAANAEERVLSMDFSVAPEKITSTRTIANAKSKAENVLYQLAIPPTGDKDFTFQCKFIPIAVRAYAGVAVGIGEQKRPNRQMKIYLRLGDGNRSTLLFAAGNDFKALTQPVTGFSVRPMTYTIRYKADSNTADFLVTNEEGGEIAKAENVALRFNDLSADALFFAVVDRTDEGESYLIYDAAKQRLEGQSYTGKNYKFVFAVDDVKITYTMP